jgi:hypothetical protein
MGAGVGSPLASIAKLPRKLSRARALNSSELTETRVPSERAMASIRSSAACAA